MKLSPILLYGANGRVGRAIQALAAERGVPLVIAGRHAERVDATDGDSGGDARIFGLATPSTVDACLDGVGLVLNCAGPASDVALPLFNACLRRGVDYLDLCDDLLVAEELRAQDAALRAANVMALPSVGFRAVAGDTVSARLAAQLPNARSLALVFCGGPLQHANELVEPKVREGGHLVTPHAGAGTRSVTCAGTERRAIRAAAVELCTAHVSTSIPDITVWRAVTAAERLAFRSLGALGSNHRVARRMTSVIALAYAAARRRRPEGAHAASVFGEVRDDAGHHHALTLETVDAEVFTAHAAFQIALRVAEGVRTPGLQTPTSLLGHDFALTLPGVKLD